MARGRRADDAEVTDVEAWMWWTALVVVLLPFALALAFHGPDRADSRGRRVETRWRARGLR